MAITDTIAQNNATPHDIAKDATSVNITATDVITTESTAQKRDNIMYITQPEPIYQTPLIPELQQEKIQILLAESDLISCERVHSALEAEGYTVIVAHDNHEILSASALYPIDLVLLDVGTPQIDGWAICTELRALTDVPIVMMMGRSRPDDIVRSIRLGADSHLAKPISVPELQVRVQTILRRTLKRKMGIGLSPHLFRPFAHHQVTMPR